MTYRETSWSIIAGLGGSALFALIAQGGFLSTLGIYLSPVPLMLAGLCYGITGCLIAGIAGAVLISVLMGGGAFAFYSVCDFIPSLLVVFLALRHCVRADGEKTWYPVGYILSWVSIFAGFVALVLIMFLTGAVASTQGVDYVSIPDALKELLRQGTLNAFGSDAQAQQAIMGAWEKLIPQFMFVIAVSWFSRVIVAALISEYVAVKVRKALRPSPSYLDLKVQMWVLFMLVLSLGLGLVTDADLAYVSVNFAAVMAIPFSFLGLTFVHKTAKEMKNAGVVLFLFYALLLLAMLSGSSPTVFIVMVVLGIFEQLSRLYRAYKAGNQGGI